MAQSRLEKIGTIFTRVNGLLRSGAMKLEDKPLWYDVYEAFPPKLEPRFDRPAPNIPIRKLFYEDDVIRAKYHKSAKQIESANLLNFKQETSTQQFIKIYNGLVESGALDKEEIFNTAKSLLDEKRQNQKEELIKEFALPEAENENKNNLVNDFKAAQLQQSNNENKSATAKPAAGGGINIENLFKE